MTIDEVADFLAELTDVCRKHGMQIRETTLEQIRFGTADLVFEDFSACGLGATCTDSNGKRIAVGRK